MITSKLTKIATVAALSFGLVAAGAGESRAGNDNLLIGSLLGGAAGAGAGYAFGKGKGAAIGGILGLAAGALVSSQVNGGGLFGAEPQPAYTGYAPPPPPAYQAPAYQAPAYHQQPPVVYQAPAYQTQAAYQPVQANPYAGYQGAVYSSGGGSQAYCRQYRANIRIDGQRQPTSGTACLQPDGTWKVVN